MLHERRQGWIKQQQWGAVVSISPHSARVRLRLVSPRLDDKARVHIVKNFHSLLVSLIECGLWREQAIQ